jgi:hydroxymethylpyrimidine/phosphomethylpyrimidine kinase
MVSFDRSDEPRSAARKTSTMSWGTRQALRSAARVPDLIADAGGPGKEPMVRVLGRNPTDVVSKAGRFLR